jgi:hypothetical protein
VAAAGAAGGTGIRRSLALGHLEGVATAA